MNLLEIAHKHGIELEGACEGSIACSTCHVIFEDQDEFEISGEITDEENDMLDLAFGLTQTYVPLTLLIPLPLISSNQFPCSF